MAESGLPGFPIGHHLLMAIGEHDERPWGNYTVLDEGVGYKVKRIVVLPGKRLSYQRHERRSEHWFGLRGSGSVTLDGALLALHEGYAVDIPMGAAHRVANAVDEPLIFVEVQRGEYVGEDDITRLADDYGRATVK